MVSTSPHDSDRRFLGSLSVGTMMLYPPYLALLADFTCELQEWPVPLQTELEMLATEIFGIPRLYQNNIVTYSYCELCATQLHVTHSFLPHWPYRPNCLFSGWV